MTQPTILTITIDGVRYVPEDSISPPRTLGGHELVVLDKGFIYVGHVEEDGDKGIWIRDASQVRLWKRNGLGGVVLDPKASEAVLDKAGDLYVPMRGVMQRHPLAEGWGQ